MTDRGAGPPSPVRPLLWALVVGLACGAAAFVGLPDAPAGAPSAVALAALAARGGYAAAVVVAAVVAGMFQSLHHALAALTDAVRAHVRAVIAAAPQWRDSMALDDLEQRADQLALALFRESVGRVGVPGVAVRWAARRMVRPLREDLIGPLRTRGAARIDGVALADWLLGQGLALALSPLERTLRFARTVAFAVVAALTLAPWLRQAMGG